jgi:hypothetical protein
MRTESAGRIGAVSSAGAMGLMQLMPGTWARQRTRFGLGPDPFDPRDNIMAGTSYLREMYDSYGASGFLAAYNAGPGRYEDWRIAVVRSPPKPAPMSPRLHRCCKRAARQPSLPAHRLCSRFAHPGHRASFSPCAEMQRRRIRQLRRRRAADLHSRFVCSAERPLRARFGEPFAVIDPFVILACHGVDWRRIVRKVGCRRGRFRRMAR